MKIAVVGAGMAGIAVCWNLLQFSGIEVTLLDPKGIGGGASGVSTGLLHPFPGKQALYSANGREGMEESLSLIRVAEKALGRPVAEEKGVLRPAITEQQRRDFSLRAAQDSDTSWCEEIGQFVSQAISVPGLWIPKGIAVYSRRYLEGLWKACLEKGAKLERTAVQILADLSSFDLIIVTAGADTLRFEECRSLPLSVTLGQSLICRWPEKLPVSLISQGHITPTEDPALCQVGSTYERTLEPDKEKAVALLEKVAQFYPPARKFSIVEIRSGFRIAPKMGYIPLSMPISSKAWVLTGFGSRGMLYHALFAKTLVRTIITC